VPAQTLKTGVPGPVLESETRRGNPTISNAAWFAAVLLGTVGAVAIVLTPPTPDESWWEMLLLAHLATVLGMIALGLRRWWQQKCSEISVPGQGPGRKTWRLSVRRWGESGQPVILLHGLGGSAASWCQTAEALGRRLRVVAPDLLGFGHSPWPKIAYTVDEHLDALDAMVAAEGLERRRIVLAGHSLGAILALTWAGRHPERFAGLVLVGLPCYRSAQEARRHAAGLGPLAYATVARPWLGALICAGMCLGRPLWRLLAPRLMPDLPPEVARDGVLHVWESYSRTLTRCILELDVRHLAAQVQRAGKPVRLLHGDRDQEAPLEMVEELARSTGWSLAVVPDTSHGLPIEQPRACAEMIRSQAATA
jgi:pimeloyl-ACP methyl ester carboxylesterase